jgi:protein TonB
MGVGGRDWREIGRSAIAAMRRRPRFVLLSSCLAVLLGSWWGTIYFADRLVSTLPDRSGPLSPLPLSADEIEEQIRRAQALNDELRAQRAAARAYTRDEIGVGLRDTVRIIDEDGDSYPSDVVDPRKHRPAPTEFVATDTPAEPVYTVSPEYPDVARAMGTSGTVVVQVLVGRDGKVADTRVLKSIPALDDAAEQAVRRWRFKPAVSEGNPVETWVSVPILFRR